MKTSRLELFFEQHEVWRVRQANDPETIPCPFCMEETPMIAAEKLAEALGESPRNIYKRIDEGSVHFVETEKMHVLVCLTSFSKRSQE